VNDPALRPAIIALAERAKRGLSLDEKVQITAEFQGHAIDLLLTRDRFEDIVGHLITRLAAPLDRALNDSGLSPDKIDKVVLVGGATRMVPVRAFAARKLRQFPVMSLDPDEVVALGAAVQAALVANDAALDDVVMTDVSAFTLGVDTVHSVGNNHREGYFAPIIERNSIIPLSREKVFSTVYLGQTSIRFCVYQGESPLVANNLYLGEITVPVPRNMTEHESALVRFTYDVSGLLEVDITVQSTGRKASLVITELAGELSDADIKSALKKMSSLKTHPRDEAANIHLRTRLEAVYAMARGQARDWVTGLLLQFDAAIEAQDQAMLATLRAELHDQIDAFEAQHVT
jgi:molecular chaperone HscC